MTGAPFEHVSILVAAAVGLHDDWDAEAHPHGTGGRAGPGEGGWGAKENAKKGAGKGTEGEPAEELASDERRTRGKGR